ncbi:MAG: response regulator transcription factor [Lachnospiraceae bacterium]|nr:response regulator transcription factor [Lachnospiraceae bacterium]
MKILLVEDERRMANATSELLKREGYDVEVEYEGEGGEDAFLTGIYDIAILDVMLPYKNGFDIVRSGRKKGIKTPVLMLTAKSDVSDKVRGLDSGADDYLTKPFQIEELLARVRALGRRGALVSPEEGILTVGDLRLDTKKLVLYCSATGKEIRLPEKEFHLMEYLITNKGTIISKEQLALKVWGYDNEAEYNNVEVYISFTRRKLKFLESKVQIKSVRGMGYELRGDEDA